jgi:histidyl-tRNA synthetase
MKIPPVKGTRDFYPEQMRIRNFIVDGWKTVSLRNGFEEYDGPIFEYLKMFQIKSGDEIAEQLFSLTDRGGRELAIRPEITPTLARMVNQKINSLPRPIKWFSVPRLCRAERPQKGRLREFFQWNIDIIGERSSVADAEVIYTTIDYLREVGLTNKDVKVKISSRKLLSLFLKGLGVPEAKLETIYTVLDKKVRLPEDTIEKMLLEQVQDESLVTKILNFMSVQNLPQIGELMKAESEEFNAYEELRGVFNNLSIMGVDDFCEFDASIVRGLAYYTGVVFEVHDVKGELRAICGGGRFDNLLRDFGGPNVPATGMGMGDCVLEILLRERGLLKIEHPPLDYFVANADRVFAPKSVFGLVAKLRTMGFSADFTYKIESLKNKLKTASERNAKYCIIVGDEYKTGRLVVKDMATGEQRTVKEEEFLASL